jgi:opacity protein-like surface antigen
MRLARLALVLPLLLTATSARAEGLDPTLLDAFGRDLGRLSVNLPVWLAQHLPSIMAPAGLGAGSGITNDAGSFKLGLMGRVGVFNRLPDVAHGLELVDVGERLPSIFPWPQLGVVAGMNLGGRVEVGADLQLVPPMDVAAEGVRLQAELLALSGTVRFRLMEGAGPLPALMLGVGGGYYGGRFSVGAGYDSPFERTLDDGSVASGTARIDAAPTVAWRVFQVMPEVRLAWDVAGLVRPYVGLGVGLSWGEVSNDYALRGTVTVDTVNGQPVTPQTETLATESIAYSARPARYTLRPHVGVDLLAGPFALTLQADFAVSGSERLNSDLEAAGASWLSDDPDYLFNRNSRNAQSHSAVVLTSVARLQF